MIAKKTYRKIKKSVFFDEKWYLNLHPEIKAAGLSALDHYLSEGWKCGFEPSPLFCGKAYLENYPDVRDNGMCPLHHYMEYGRFEHRNIGVIPVKKNVGSWFSRALARIRCVRFSVLVSDPSGSGKLGEALDSVLQQSYKDFQVIVLEPTDCKLSPDYKDGCIRRNGRTVFVQIDLSQKGYTKVLGELLPKCSGNYICFCEGGSRWDADHLKNLAYCIRYVSSHAVIANRVELEGPVSAKTAEYLDVLSRLENTGGLAVDAAMLTFNPIASFSCFCAAKKDLLCCDFNCPENDWAFFWICKQLLASIPLLTVQNTATHAQSLWTKGFIDSNATPDERKQVEIHMAMSILYACNSTNLSKSIRQKLQHRLISKSTYNALKNSPLFDASYYRGKYMEGTSMQNGDPILHYYLCGWKYGYDPSPSFSSSRFHAWYPWPFVTCECPLAYYLSALENKTSLAYFPVAAPPVFYAPPNFNEEAYRADKRKILLVTHELSYTGAPMLLISISEMLRDLGYYSVVLSPSDGPLKEEMLRKGIPVIVDVDACFDENGYEPYLRQGFFFCLFNTCLLFQAFHNFHHHIPSMWWLHDNLKKSHHYEGMRNLISKYPEKIFVASTLTRTYYDYYSDKLQILSYPVKDVVGERFQIKKTPIRIRCLIVGTYDNRKGQDIAVEAMKLLPDSYRNKLELNLVGKAGVQAGFVLNLEKGARSAGNVHFVAPVHDREAYHDLYETHDVLLCPSREDPYPLVVLDALMHGCPVVLSDHVGQRDLVRETACGYVFPSEDAMALAGIFKKLVDGAGDMPSLSEAARRTFVQSSDYRVCAERFQSIITTMTASHPVEAV